jgi:hypothetical protein
MKTRQRSDTTLSEAAATVPPAELNARSASESGSHDSRPEPSPTPVDPKQADAAATVRGPTQRTGVSRSQTPTRDFLEGTARAPEKLRRQATAVADGRKSSRYDAPKDEMHDFQRGGPSPYADRHSKRVAAAATMRGPTQRMGVSRSQTPARAFLEGTALPPQRLRQRDSIPKSTAVDEDAAKAAWLAKLDQPSWGGKRDFQRESPPSSGKFRRREQCPSDGPMERANPYRATAIEEKNFNVASMTDFTRPYGMNRGRARQNSSPQGAMSAPPGSSFAPSPRVSLADFTRPYSANRVGKGATRQSNVDDATPPNVRQPPVDDATPPNVRQPLVMGRVAAGAALGRSLAGDAAQSSTPSSSAPALESSSDAVAGDTSPRPHSEVDQPRDELLDRLHKTIQQQEVHISKLSARCKVLVHATGTTSAVDRDGESESVCV